MKISRVLFIVALSGFILMGSLSYLHLTYVEYYFHEDNYPNLIELSPGDHYSDGCYCQANDKICVDWTVYGNNEAVLYFTDITGYNVYEDLNIREYGSLFYIQGSGSTHLQVAVPFQCYVLFENPNSSLNDISILYSFYLERPLQRHYFFNYLGQALGLLMIISCCAMIRGKEQPELVPSSERKNQECKKRPKIVKLTLSKSSSNQSLKDLEEYLAATREESE